MTGYIVLVAGLLMWSLGHLFKRLLPAQRKAMGERGKGLVAILSLAGIVLMVLGYRWAPFDPLWYPESWATHVNNLLMLLAFYLFAASGMKTRVAKAVRHPQLWGVRLWAIGHLITNGTVADLILFGGLLVWAQLSVFLINRAEPYWEPTKGETNTGKEIGAAVGAVVVMLVVGLIHGWLGPWPFGG